MATGSCEYNGWSQTQPYPIKLDVSSTVLMHMSIGYYIVDAEALVQS